MRLASAVRRAIVPWAMTLLPAIAVAQSPRQARGAWVAAGMTVGSGTLSCTACGSATQSHTGLAPGVMLGYTISPAVAAAIDITGTISAHDGVRERHGALTVNAIVFPLGAVPVSVAAGAGFTRYRRDIPRTGGARDHLGTSGFGWRAGIAYDVALTPSLALVPSVAYLAGAESDLVIGDAASGYTASHHTIAASLRLAWNFTANPFTLGTRR